MSRVLLTGANGVVGYPLSQYLSDADITFYRVSRALKDQENSVRWDMQNALDEPLIERLKVAEIDTLIHCSPIWLLPAHLQNLYSIGVRRIVAFSSSSVTSKQNSTDTEEQLLVKQLSKAEDAVAQFCNNQGIAYTIFRPSMIYGYARDQNITHIAKFIKRFGFMLLIGQANGLRQPVHADDLATASLTVLNNAASEGKTYYMAGETTLTYRAMVDAIFNGLNKRSIVVSLPLIIFRSALRVAALVGRFSYTAEMANRMNQDLVYDISPAQQDFLYSPQSFLTNPERDLP